PGMYAEVNLTLDRRTKVLAIPVMAVDLDSNADAPGAALAGQVMIVTPNNRVEKRKVMIGLETATIVEIRSGLNEGDSVVLSGRAALQPGQEVRPKVTTLAADSR